MRGRTIQLRPEWSMTFSRRLLDYTERVEYKRRCPISANPTDRRRKNIETCNEEGRAVLTLGIAAWTNSKMKTLKTRTSSLDNYRPVCESQTSSREAINKTSLLKNDSTLTTRSGGRHSTLSRTFHNEGISCNVAVTEESHREFQPTYLER
jgi:hypothetical protein